MAPRRYSDNDVIVQEGAASVILALVAATDVYPTRAKHVVGHRTSKLSVAAPTNILVDRPDLDATQLFRFFAAELKTNIRKDK